MLYKIFRKITKRSYINEQVLNRIPDNLDNCRELLKFGLKGNDLPALVELANEKPEDLGFIFGEDGEGENDDDDEGEYRGFDPEEKIEFERKKLEKRNSKYLSKIDFSNLNQAQERFSLVNFPLVALHLTRMLNPYLEIVDKKSTNWELSERHLWTKNPQKIFLGIQ